MNPGNSIAWARPGAVPAAQAFGGTQREVHAVAAGGMDYEEVDRAQTMGRYHCSAMKKDGEPCQGWCVEDSKFCQGHTAQLEKLNRKIASCEDEAERLLLEEERLRKWL